MKHKNLTIIFVILGVTIVAMSVMKLLQLQSTEEIASKPCYHSGFSSEQAERLNPEMFTEMNDDYEKFLAAGMSHEDAAREYCRLYSKTGVGRLCVYELAREKKYNFYNHNYALDENNVYLARKNGGSTPVYLLAEQIEKNSFVYFTNGYFKDKNGFYYDYFDSDLNRAPTNKITNVDLDSVRVVENNGLVFVADKNNVYYENIIYELPYLHELPIVEGADPQTLEPTETCEEYELQDKNNYYVRDFGKLLTIPKK